MAICHCVPLCRVTFSGCTLHLRLTRGPGELLSGPDSVYQPLPTADHASVPSPPSSSQSFREEWGRGRKGHCLLVAVITVTSWGLTVHVPHVVGFIPHRSAERTGAGASPFSVETERVRGHLMSHSAAQAWAAFERHSLCSTCSKPSTLLRRGRPREVTRGRSVYKTLTWACRDGNCQKRLTCIRSANLK